MRLVITLILLLTTTCTNEVVDIEEASSAGVGIEEIDASEPDIRTEEEELLEEQVLITEREDIQRRIEEGLPMPEEVVNDQSAYQRGLITKEQRGSNSAGLLLARMTVSEGTSLMPLALTWKRDMQGILQVVRNNQLPKETLFEALGRHSPHVARLRPYTRPRQRWTSTLPAEGDGPPDLWVECTSWYEVKRGRRKGQKRGLPKGCNGVWKNGIEAWAEVRKYGSRLVKQKNPPRPIQGSPKTWGGKMDIWAFLKKNPHMCWLESGDTLNFFFGLRSDTRNECKMVPPKLMSESKVINAQIVKQDLRRKRREQRQQRTHTRARHP